jgi:hypothetical protein
LLKLLFRDRRGVLGDGDASGRAGLLARSAVLRSRCTTRSAGRGAACRRWRAACRTTGRNSIWAALGAICSSLTTGLSTTSLSTTSLSTTCRRATAWLRTAAPLGTTDGRGAGSPGRSSACGTSGRSITGRGTAA